MSFVLSLALRCAYADAGYMDDPFDPIARVAPLFPGVSFAACDLRPDASHARAPRRHLPFQTALDVSAIRLGL